MVKACEVLSKHSFDEVGFYREKLINEKVIIFNNVEINEEDVSKFISLISGIDEEPRVNVQYLQQHIGLNRIPLDCYNEEYYTFVKSNWHIDNSSEVEPHCYIPIIISMKMEVFNCPQGLGRTLFIDSEKMLKDTPVEILEWMKESFLVNLMGYRHENSYITPGLFNDTIYPLRVFPMIRTHPVSGKNHFVYISSKYDCYPHNPQMLQKYREFTENYLMDKDNWIICDWHNSSMVIWDNRSVLHSFEPGWQDDDRVFTRYQTGLCVPFYEIT